MMRNANIWGETAVSINAYSPAGLPVVSAAAIAYGRNFAALQQQRCGSAELIGDNICLPARACIPLSVYAPDISGAKPS